MLPVITSAGWIAIIVLGAFLVTFGNIRYQVAANREREQRASAKASEILKMETANNLTQVGKFREAIALRQIPLDGFQTTAWKIVSDGGLLNSIPTETLGKVANIYYLIDLANSYQSQLLELSMGTAASMTSSQQSRDLYMANLKKVIDQLEPKLAAEKLGAVPTTSP